MSASSVVVGIDVAKAHVDVAVLGAKLQAQRFDNQAEGHSGGSNRATALSLNGCPYLANLFFHHRPRVQSSMRATSGPTRGEVWRITFNPGLSIIRSCTTTAPSIGSWCRAPHASPATRRPSCRPRISTYNLAAEPPRVENPDVIPLVMIEVQTGSYLGEDDVERLNDTY